MGRRPDRAARPGAAAGGGEPDLTTLTELADQLVDLLADEDPLNELLQGYPGYDHRLPDLDEAAGERLKGRARQLAIAASTVDTHDAVTRGVVVQQAEAVATRVDARLIEHTVADFDISPIIVLLARLPEITPDGVDRQLDFLTRLAGVPNFLASARERNRGGLAAGRLPVASRVQAAIDHLDTYLASPAQDPLLRPTLTGPRVAERDRLLRDVIRPAFAGYRDTLAELRQHGRPDERPGLCWLPDGQQTYAALARMHTTTERTPEELHRTGLDLIERLGEEYLEIGGPLFNVSRVAEVHHRMRTDPTLRWSSGEEVLTSARAAMDRAEAAAPGWLGLIPEQRCGLKPVPLDQADNASSASYQPGSLDGRRAGVFHVNNHRATERDRCVGEANTFHETIPGHHVQITLAQQLPDVPLLRRIAWINAYMEGWALYSERLADEMGLYSDDVARLGMLANDSMRAARLVVDTGLHDQGWSRQRVVDFLRANTVMSEVEIQTETDRYIEWPGQALSYLVGRLEIQRLRARAEAALGTSFDLRSFHDLVLGGGPVPMAVLDDVVAQFVERCDSADFDRRG
jgi:uncharacterized protein (DUF885 family)